MQYLLFWGFLLDNGFPDGNFRISANIILRLRHHFPDLRGAEYETVFTIAIIMIPVMFGRFLSAETLFSKKSWLFCDHHGAVILISLSTVNPLPGEVVQGLVPSIPQEPGGKMMIVAFVGTTMEPPLSSRRLFVKGKGWTLANLKQPTNHAIVAVVLVIIISAAIMAEACGAYIIRVSQLRKYWRW